MNNLKLIHQGKVRDIYALDNNKMLMVSSDRLSAFDVVFDQTIKNKGKMLTSIANFWFNKTSHIIANHLISDDIVQLLGTRLAQKLDGSAIIVKRLRPLKIEAIVRGYIIGSGWHSYQKNGKVCGIALPPNLQLAEKLPQPIYTPSTKERLGKHDENITFIQSQNIIGKDLAKQVRDKSMALYKFASDFAFKKGIIIADTKFEFGLDENNNLTLMDEVLTPDSSRFWLVKDYQVGVTPSSFDKQIVRDYLETLVWNKQPPAPVLPNEIIQKTAAKYQEVETILCN